MSTNNEPKTKYKLTERWLQGDIERPTKLTGYEQLRDERDAAIRDRNEFAASEVERFAASLGMRFSVGGDVIERIGKERAAELRKAAGAAAAANAADAAAADVADVDVARHDILSMAVRIQIEAAQATGGAA